MATGIFLISDFFYSFFLSTLTDMNRPPGYALSRMQEISNLPTLPSVLVEVLNHLQNPNVSFDTLQSVVAKDPALTARLLRIANSSYFGRQKPTSSLTDAFLSIGVNGIILIISSIGVVNVFGGTTNQRFDRRILWKHSVSTASMVRYLTRKLQYPESEVGEIATAALLHDIGHIVIGHYFPEEFGRILTGVGKGGDPLELERECLGNDHAELSSYLAKYWRFSGSMIDMLHWHHTPPENHPDAQAMYLVKLADRLCSWRKQDEPPVSPLELVSNPGLLEPILPFSTLEQRKIFSASFNDCPAELIRIQELADSMYN
ncbi:MAG: HDOD domain-containing protein [bacterium]|nr:HDOD domain-containing protein [bacterium]